MIRARHVLSVGLLAACVIASSPARADVDRPWALYPSGAVDVGYGSTIPSIGNGTPIFQLLGRLGFALHQSPSSSWILGAQTGAAFGFNTGSSNDTSQPPKYGYLLRAPFAMFGEYIYSRSINSANSWYINIHGGLEGGPEFLMAAQCKDDTCRYIQPGGYWGVGARTGASFSYKERSALGFFVSWHNDFASCAVTEGDNCASWLSTMILSLGWTAF